MNTSSPLRRPAARWHLLIACGLLLLLPAPWAAAATYTLPGTLPAGCTATTSTLITCSNLNLGWNDSIVVSQANTTLNVTGTVTPQGNSINTSNPAAGFTLNANQIDGSNFFNLNGQLTVSGTLTLSSNSNNITGNISAGGDTVIGGTITGSLSTSGNLTTQWATTITGDVSADGFSSGGGSRYGGNLSATRGDVTTGSGDRITGDIRSDNGKVSIAPSGNTVGGSITAKGEITLGSRTSVGGDVVSTNDEVILKSSDTRVGGNVTAMGKVTLESGTSVSGDVVSTYDEVNLKSSNATVGGNVTAKKKVKLESGTRVFGYVTSEIEDVELNSSDARVDQCISVGFNREIKLGWHAVVGGVCCRSGDTCDRSCVENESGYALPSTALCASSDTRSAPIAEWRLDEPAWNGTAGEVKDSGGQAKHGRAVNGAGTAAGKICQAGVFDGTTNRYVQLPESVQTLPTLVADDFTQSLWVKPGKTHEIDSQSTNSTNGISGQNYALYPGLSSTWNWDTGGYAGAGLSVGTNGISVYEHAGSYMPPVLVWSGTVSTTEWTHVAVVYSSGVPSLYVNGVFKKTGVEGTHPNHLSVVPTFYVGSAYYGNYLGGVDEYKVFASPLSAAQIAAGYANENSGKNWDGSTRTCAATSAAPAALNAVEVGANPVSGQITTKTAGTAFNLDIVALNAARTAQDSAASGDVLLDLLANTTTGVALDGNNCPTSSTALTVGTATLTAGKASVAMGAIANSWRDVRVRMRYPATGTATVTACSVDNFAVKPAALSAIASHGDWLTAGDTTLANSATSGGVVHKAGQPFKLRITGYNAVNTVTSNYNGSPTASSTCVLPASGCLAGTLSVGSYSASAGTVSSSTATYSEVGTIAATFVDSTYASVDSDDSAASCAGFHACASAIQIGRFVPDHYDVSAIQTPVLQTFASACASRSFTYVGQPFGFYTLPRARITAKNAAGGTTGNYRGNLWKLSPNGHFGSSWRCRKSDGTACGSVRISTPGFSAEQVSINNDGSGDFTWPADEDFPNGLSYQFNPTTPPRAPFNAEIGLGILISDNSESAGCGLPSCIIRDSQDGASPTWGTQIAFDAGNAFRQGRLRLSNAMGSERLPLPVRLTAQYWNGEGWVNNPADDCTALAAPTLTFFSQTADNQLTSGETTASYLATLVAGSGNLRFSAPGIGNFGYMNVSATAPDWLKYNWDGVDQNSDGNLLDDNPVARATFGKRKGRDKIIIRRETY